MNRAPGAGRFQTTRWSLVLAAADEARRTEAASLDELCRAYWYPLYAFARRSGHDEACSQDLVQGFFSALIEKDYLLDADQDRGRFRTFLLASFRHHASKEREKAAARKRGGDQTILSLDFEDGERRYRAEPTGDDGPEAVFERRWAHALLDRAFTALAATERGGSPARAERYEHLRHVLRGGPQQPYRELGEALGLSETAVKVAVHRLRKRFGGCLRQEIADTLSDERLVEDELLRLREALAR